MFCHIGKPLDQQDEVHCRSKLNQHAAAQQGGPDISRLDLHLQDQWGHAANAHLGNMIMKPHSSKKVGWICDQCPDGHLHSWSSAVTDRTRGGGCSQCSGRKVCKHNSLATKEPELAAQWDYEKNDDTPDSVVAQSHRVAGWHCDACGHKWSVSVNARVSNGRTGCPQCAKFARTAKRVTHPTIIHDPFLLAQWDHKRNAEQGHFPDKIRLRSNKQIFWLCNMCPAGQQHSWPAMPLKRTARPKSGCPCCAGRAACKCNSLQALYPSIAADWDHGKNQGLPSDYPARSTYLAWWSSLMRGSWQQTVASRSQSIQQRSARLKLAEQRLSSANPASD